MSFSLRIRFVLLAIVLASICAFSVTHAQTTDSSNGFVPLAQYQSGSKLGDLYASNGDLASFVNKAFTFAISLGAILAVMRLAYAGYIYLVSGLEWAERSHAREIIADVILGLLLLLSVWLILHQINPDILNLNVLDKLKQLPTSATSPASPSTGAATPSAGFDPSTNGCGVSGCSGSPDPVSP